MHPDTDAAEGAAVEREPEQKRALSSLEPPTRQSGDFVVSRVLFDALARACGEESDALTHGFHSYPARMHRAVAAALLDAFAKPGMLVVDPFCGSGTTLVEARVRRLKSLGIDLNPLALRLARLKTTVLTEVQLQHLEGLAHGITERSKQRVRQKDDARAPVSREEAARYMPHVLKELAVVLSEIDATPDEDERRALELVLTAILTKVSKRRSETDPREQQRTIGRFIPSEMFEKKAVELCARLRQLAAAATSAAKVELRLDDMRRVKLDKPADLIVTSPPYGGTYDYVSHHDGRIEWLGLDDKGLEELELGARRRLSNANPRRWDEEVSEMLASLQRMLSPTGMALLLMGDGEVGGTRVQADEQLRALATGAGLTVVASASAPRRDWRGQIGREEHLVALKRA